MKSIPIRLLIGDSIINLKVDNSEPNPKLINTNAWRHLLGIPTDMR